MNPSLPPDDPRAVALARLQASRERLRLEMRPGGSGRAFEWLEHPWRVLRRWWRRRAPDVSAASQWLHTTPDPHLMREAGAAALDRGRRWVERHPMAAVALGGALGLLLIRKRAWLWGLTLGLGKGVLRHGQLWALARLTDPALYAALLAAFMARPDADDEPPSADEPPLDGQGGEPGSVPNAAP